MKTGAIILSILAVFAILVGCSNYTSTSKTTEVVTIRDITDMMTVTPKVEDITPLFDLQKEKWNGGIFRLVDLSDVSYNRTHEVNIEAENQWLSNEFTRNDAVKTFYSDINKTLSNSSKETIGKNNSSLYFPIATELNHLSQSHANKRIMLIYSDLMENTESISFYKKGTLTKLTTNPDSIKEQFELQMKLGNLSGITIYLIYQPVNTTDDEKYRIVSNFYKHLFESYGASVEITANVN